MSRPHEHPAPTGPSTHPTTTGADVLSFGEALELLKSGERLTRAGWNGRGMWLFLVPGSTLTVQAGRPLGEAAPDLVGQTVEYRPHIDMKTVDGQIVPWVASQSDLLADDWLIVVDLEHASVIHTIESAQ
ncbi:DUF2829 domain-containing protein [Nonomuraea sp. NPDC005650]|uniref:DUF2829 domain-containing protein n=1 Tax=Nonomuraea sp. NPDC005650 TaxID=3157045 RepID=UPI0033ACDE24